MGVWRKGFLRSVITPVKIHPMVKLTAKQVQILNVKNFATVATVMADGSPEASLGWIETDGTYIYFNTAMHRLKARNLKRDPRAPISTSTSHHPYPALPPPNFPPHTI